MNKNYAWAAVVVVAALMFLTRARSPDRPTGALQLITPNAELRLQSNEQSVTVSQEKGPVTLFAGTYQPTELALTSGPYRLVSEGPFGKLGTITVAEGRTDVLGFGPPLTVKADVSNSRGPQVLIGLTIVGKAGEEYAPVAERNGMRLGPPAIRILDGKGNVLERGTFAFG